MAACRSWLAPRGGPMPSETASAPAAEALRRQEVAARHAEDNSPRRGDDLRSSRSRAAQSCRPALTSTTCEPHLSGALRSTSAAQGHRRPRRRRAPDSVVGGAWRHGARRQRGARRTSAAARPGLDRRNRHVLIPGRPASKEAPAATLSRGRAIRGEASALARAGVWGRSASRKEAPAATPAEDGKPRRGITCARAGRQGTRATI